MPKIEKNHICSNCLKWEKFAHKCSVFWEGKKECTLKVESQDEWNAQQQILNI